MLKISIKGLTKSSMHLGRTWTDHHLSSSTSSFSTSPLNKKNGLFRTRTRARACRCEPEAILEYAYYAQGFIQDFRFGGDLYAWKGSYVAHPIGVN